jgi:hypothetical protein
MIKIIEFKGIEFEIEFDYQPFEPAERGIEAQYPGCPESIESVHSMKHKDTDFLECIYEGNENEINELILDNIHS